MLLRVHFLILFFLPIVPAYAETATQNPSSEQSAIQSLQKNFGGACSFSNSLADFAQSQANSLQNLIHDMQSTQDCKGLAPFTTELQKSMQGLADLAPNTHEVLNLQQHIKDLQLAIANENQKGAAADQIFIKTANAQILNYSQQITKLQETTSQLAATNQDIGLTVLRANANSLIAAIQQNSTCINSPSLAGQLAGRLISLSPLVDPGFSSTLSLAAGSLVENIFSFLHDQKFTNAEEAIFNETMIDSLGCALESLAATSCQARDLLRVLEINEAQQQIDIGAVSNCFADLTGIISREVSSLRSWYFHMISSPGADTLRALTRSRVNSILDGKLGSLSTKLRAPLVEQLEKGDAADLDVNRQEAVDELLKVVTGYLYNKNGNQTITQAATNDDLSELDLSNLFKEDPFCGPTILLYTGGAFVSRPLDSLNNSRSLPNCSAVIKQDFPGHANIPSYKTLEAAIERLESYASDMVDEMRISAGVEGAEANLASTFEAGQAGKHSPYEILLGIRSYINLLNVELAQGKRKGIEPQAIHALQELARVIQGKTDQIFAAIDTIELGPPTASERSADGASSTDPAIISAVRKISHILSDGFYFTNVSRLITLDFNQRLRSEGYSPTVLAIMREAALPGTTSALLAEIQGKQLLAQKSADSAIGKSETNLAEMMKIFSGSWEKVLTTLHEKSVSNNSPTNSRRLALACMRSLLVPNVQDYVDQYCKGSLYPFYKDYLSYDEWKKKKYDERVCSIYDFNRKIRLIDESRGGIRALAKTPPKPLPTSQPVPLQTSQPRRTPAAAPGLFDPIYNFYQWFFSNK